MPRLVARPWEGKPSERRTNRPIARRPGARADPVCRTARPNDGPVLSLRRRHRVEMRSIPEPGMTRLRPAGRAAPPGGPDRRTGLPRPFPAPRAGAAPDGSPFSPPGRSTGPAPARCAPPSPARKTPRRPEGSPASRSPPVRKRRSRDRHRKFSCTRYWARATRLRKMHDGLGFDRAPDFFADPIPGDGAHNFTSLLAFRPRAPPTSGTGPDPAPRPRRDYGECDANVGGVYP